LFLLEMRGGPMIGRMLREKEFAAQENEIHHGRDGMLAAGTRISMKDDIVCSPRR